MSETIFRNVQFNLKGLMGAIALGQVGLPDIQRPFVWDNAKVRDLFDSMYRGYPIGHLLFWDTGPDNIGSANPQTIGAERKQLKPQFMVVDGQQRLTSLYAVIQGEQVIGKDYRHRRIRIAFNPLDEKFEVTSAAIERDKVYIPDISRVWSDDADIFGLVDGYLAGLRDVRTVSADDERKIKNSVVKLNGLTNFPLTALQLSADISEEDAAEVFVRVNSKGEPLNQADFILTLMSVFWDEGRADLERFYRESLSPPAKGATASYNHLIEPSPDQLLRVSIALAFKRARLRYVYSILRGKDLVTEQFSEENRIAQFDTLKKAQSRVLNLTYWHDFINCIRGAGFRSRGMIRSNNNFLFCYALYLIGRTELKVEEATLRRAIAQWFFMSSVTRRYTSSPESTFESDLAMLRGVTLPEEFVGRLQQACSIQLTDDFWRITLTNELVTSSVASPALSVFEASLTLLDAPVLFSNSKVSDMLDPAVQGFRTAIERHHLFPRAYLAKLGLTETRDTNQIANLAFLEWGDNSTASDYSPADYVPVLKLGLKTLDLEKMYRYNALPKDWEAMEYQDFLARRRELMAEIIHDGYRKLTEGTRPEAPVSTLELAELIGGGESESVEFKSTLRVNLHTGLKDIKMENVVLKTLAGFLNKAGGTLVVGVSDDGTPIGIEADQFMNEDQMSLHLVNIVKDRMGTLALSKLHQQFDDYADARVLRVHCERSHKPVYVKEGDKEVFYIRTGPATIELFGGDMVEYINHWFN